MIEYKDMASYDAKTASETSTEYAGGNNIDRTLNEILARRGSFKFPSVPYCTA